MKKFLNISSHIQKAIEASKPVVALESTIISHGMPWPKNLQTAEKCEEIIRENGAIPATIAVIDGKIRVGLHKNELEVLAQAKNVYKASRRDLPFLLATEKTAGTTVASTMIAASMAGIRIFATGGIGGVHRGASRTFDVSADLKELATTNVAVVCAGCKSVLDIGLTLEYLETQGVPVLGFQTGEFPAFYTRRSGFKVDWLVEDERQMAAILHTKWGLALQGGVVIGNPVPSDFAMEQDLINEAIDHALEEAEHLQIRGKEVTPFLLSRIEKITEGKSLETNQALVFNNCALAARIALKLSLL